MGRLCLAFPGLDGGRRAPSREAAKSPFETALGASRRELMQQFLTEAIVLGLIGGALGMLLAVWGIDLLDKIVPASISIPNSNADVMRPPLVIDGAVLLFTLAVSIVTSLVFGLAPAVAATRGDVQTALRDRSRASAMCSTRFTRYPESARRPAAVRFRWTKKITRRIF